MFFTKRFPKRSQIIRYCRTPNPNAAGLTEHVYLQDIRSVQDAWLGLKDFFNFYNHERLHQSLGYLTPTDVYLGGSLKMKL